MRLNLIAILVFMWVCSPTGKSAEKYTGTKRVIFDTDMGPDYDDVGAIALLHAFADSGSVEILATMASTKHENVGPVLDALNTWFGRPDLPIGVPKGSALTMRDGQHWSDTLISKYPHDLMRNDDASDATQLYRQILSQQPDSSVTIITVGFLTNIAALMRSSADDLSPLNGEALIRQKVKQLVCMAGRFPEGREFNIAEDALSARHVFENLDIPILFSGFEIGAKIKTGLPLIRNTAIAKSPVKDVFRISIPLAREDSAGRMSWDQTAVLVGVKGHRPWYTVRRGRIRVAPDGTNTWSEEGDAHSYLVEDRPAAEVEQLINDLMMHRPVGQDSHR